MSLLARLLSMVYGALVSARGWMYDRDVLRSYRSTIPVISVGNITAGGNGKTPLCMLLVHEMRKRGFRPAVLSRGYGGKERGPHRVSAADSPTEVGDEPVLMLQEGIPTFISRSRTRGMQMIEKLNEFDLVILDDGFQHRALKRDVDIVSIFAGSEKAIEEFVRGALLPAGLFRERREPALRRASMVVLSHRAVLEANELPEIDPRLLKLLAGSGLVFRSYLQASAVSALVDGSPVDPQKVCALAAIANPEGFFQSLEHQGFSVVERFAFADHHQFLEDELEALVNKHPGVLFVCTSKDAVKLRSFSERIRKRFAVLRVMAHVVPHDAFFTQLERLIKRPL